MAKVLVVDVSYLMFRSYFGYPDLTVKMETENGVQTLPIGAFFGFVKTILTIIHNYKIDELILAADLPFATWRHDALDNYKSGRKEMDENLRVQIPLINEWCEAVTNNFLKLRGLEADDLIASSIINLNNNLNNFTQNLENPTENPTEKTKQNLTQNFNSNANLNLEQNPDLENSQNPQNLQKIDKIINKLIVKIEIGQNEEIGQLDKMANFLDFRDKYIYNSNQNSQNLAEKKEKNLDKIDLETNLDLETSNLQIQNLQTLDLENLDLQIQNLQTLDSDLENEKLENEKTNINLETNSSEKKLQNGQNSEIFIYSKDRDLFQLLVFENVFFVQNESKFEVFGQKEFQEKYFLHPNQWLCYKTLVGDASDKLDGVAGIGAKTATQILQKYGSVQNFVKPATNSENENLENEQKIDEIIDKTDKLSKWKSKIETEKIAEIRRLSSLCWIDLELESGFDLHSGTPLLVKYKFGSLLTMQNKITNKTPNKNANKIANNSGTAEIEMETLF